mmetsp:Transcript_95723/g.270916  ORF Transcript_95723/g.270916 Transcript_95723/m.270916 type:complete len:337 (+) Transcript_95723:297-1307(+)
MLAARFSLPPTGSSGSSRASESDAAFALRTFGLQPDAVPVMFFLWGGSAVRAARLAPQEGFVVPAEAFERLVGDVCDHVRQDWAEKGWVEKEEGRVMDVKDLERRRAVEHLHTRMAESLLAALSAAQAEDLVRRGVASAGDFVTEDVAVGLDADAAAEMLREEHLREREERAQLRAAQEEEFAEAEAADAARREAQIRALRAEEEAREEAEAREIWARMDRQHRLEGLPEEPPEIEACDGASGVLAVTVILPGGGRRLVRRWRGSDPARAVAEFAFGSASEDELPHAGGPPRLVFGFPRVEMAPDDVRCLHEVGVASRDVLRALPAEAKAAAEHAP